MKQKTYYKKRAASDDLLNKHIANQNSQATHDQQKSLSAASDDLLNKHIANQNSQATHNQSSKRFFLKTMGCQMNVADSNYVANQLKSFGLLQASNIDKADIAIINTCTVREHAEKRALSEIGNLKTWKTTKPDRTLAVIGCVAERLGEDLKRHLPFVDLVIGAKRIKTIPEIVINKVNEILHPDITSGFRMTQCSKYNSKSDRNSNFSISAFVNIMRGCNNFCSYCVVPYVRGKEKSRPLDEIINEIKSLVKDGTKEVTLLGQNVNSYKYGNKDFADVLTEVNKIKGLHRIRYMTNHPKDMNDKIIDTIARLKKTCNHIHLPLQSGSNRVLKLMNRKYDRETYLKLIKKIRKKIPNVSITTDVMVGFPEETEKDFNGTCNIVKKVKYDFCYVFKYSPRKETRAYKYGDTISAEVKSRRHKKLLDLCNNIAKMSNSKFTGKTVEVLAEKYENCHIMGKTSDNRPVTFLSNKSFLGKILPVRITGSKVHSLIGSINPCPTAGGEPLQKLCNENGKKYN